MVDEKICATCEHKLCNPNTGWCYMFKEKPDMCLKHEPKMVDNYGEPWEVFGKHGDMTAVVCSTPDDNKGFPVAECLGPNRDANAARIALCVNACVGMNDEDLRQLKDANGKGLLSALGMIKAELTEARELLGECLDPSGDVYKYSKIRTFLNKGE